jgi:hypothetical protein
MSSPSNATGLHQATRAEGKIALSPLLIRAACEPSGYFAAFDLFRIDSMVQGDNWKHQ